MLPPILGNVNVRDDSHCSLLDVLCQDHIDQILPFDLIKGVSLDDGELLGDKSGFVRHDKGDMPVSGKILCRDGKCLGR